MEYNLPDWYCVQVHDQRSADLNLGRQGFEAFWPSIKRKWHPEPEPLFRGYGFVSFDRELDRWTSINGTYGVVGLLPRHPLSPRPVSPALIGRLLELGRDAPIPEDAFLENFAPEDAIDPLSPGAEVEVRRGLLQGRRGTVLDARRKLLLISLLGRHDENRDIWIGRSDCVPAAGTR